MGVALVRPTMATLVSPRRAVVDEDWPAKGKKRKAGTLQLPITQGEHVVVFEKVGASRYLVSGRTRR